MKIIIKNLYLIIFFSCQKEQLNISHFMYIYNNTSDILILHNYTEDSCHYQNIVHYPQTKLLLRTFLGRMLSYNIYYYKINDSLPYLIFNKGIVYNYKVNFFDINNWEKRREIKVKLNTCDLCTDYEAAEIYTFEIKRDNIINP